MIVVGSRAKGRHLIGIIGEVEHRRLAQVVPHEFVVANTDGLLLWPVLDTLGDDRDRLARFVATNDLVQGHPFGGAEARQIQPGQNCWGQIDRGDHPLDSLGLLSRGADDHGDVK